MVDTVNPGENALSILPLDRAKRDFAVFFDDDDQLITDHINAGVAWVENFLNVPLIQRRSEWNFYRFDLFPSMCPMAIPSNSVRLVQKIKYWSQDSGDITADPDGELGVGDVGRIIYTDDWTKIYPPSTGWPDRLVRSDALIETVDQSHLGQNSAVVAGCSQVARLLYNGQAVVTTNPAFRVTLGPLVNTSGTVPDIDRTPSTEYVDLSGGG